MIQLSTSQHWLVCRQMTVEILPLSPNIQHRNRAIDAIDLADVLFERRSQIGALGLKVLNLHGASAREEPGLMSLFNGNSCFAAGG
jgi:hypothetical protein